jgi:peptidoglycan-associated lipoprotein
MARGAVLVAGLMVFGLTGCQSQGTSGSEGETGTGSEFDQGGSGGGGTADVGPSVLEPVYFDYDRADLRSDARATLQSNADAINNGNMGSITIEGYCDERGSEEYNLALGERRANGVKRYLVDLGVPSSKLSTVSFGEARPAVAGHTEAAYKYNRRAEFKAR